MTEFDKYWSEEIAKLTNFEKSRLAWHLHKHLAIPNWFERRHAEEISGRQVGNCEWQRFLDWMEDSGVDDDISAQMKEWWHEYEWTTARESGGNQPMPSNNEPFSARRVGATGHEILNRDSQVIAWTVDAYWAAVFVGLLNQGKLINDNPLAQFHSLD